MIAGIERFLGVDGKQVGMKVTEYQMAANFIGVTRRLERNVDRWSTDGFLRHCVLVLYVLGIVLEEASLDNKTA